MKLLRAFALCVLAIPALSSAAAVPEMVRDINIAVPIQSSLPRQFGSTSTHTYFIADELSQRPHLWRTDGTTAGTEQVAAIPSLFARAPAVDLGERLLLFLAPDPAQMSDLWVTDGTSSGTQRLFENAWFLGRAPTFALFERRIADGISEVWRSDATPQGTVMVVPARPGAGFFGGSGVAVAGKSYLVGPRELIWVSDGTAAGTREAPIDGNVAPARSINDLVATSDAAYFRYFFASDATVWRIDPANDTVSQLPMPAGYAAASAKALVNTSHEVFFITQTAAGSQLWRAGGSPGPTLLLETDDTGSISDLRAIGSRVVFVVTERITTKTLWGSDGTPGGTQQLGAFAEFIVGTQETHTVSAKDDPPVFSTGAAGELWVTDGTPAGTGPSFTLAANELVSEMAHRGDRVYIATSAHRLLSVRLSTRASETLSTSMFAGLSLAPFGVWFVGQSNVSGYEPFGSDGTAAGTRLLKNIADDTASGDSLPADFIEFNGALYFSADDGVVGRELWRSDGTSAGTRLFADLVNGPMSSHPVAPFVAGNRLYFFTLADARTLWSTDGTNAPVKVGPPDNSVDTLSPWRTHPVFPLLRNWSCPQPRAAQLGGQFYFPAYAFQTGWELWKTDGTQVGTQLAVDLVSGFQQDSQPCTVVALDNRLFFTAVDAQGARKLWSSNGSVAGTQAIETLSATARVGELFGPVVSGSALYFTTPAEGGAPSRLWRSNGSAGSATVVHEAAAGASISIPVVVSNRLLFTEYPPAGTATTTGELWATDGTAAGTGLLAARVAAGAGAVLAAGSQLFFTRTDDATGAEPWRTDGTPSGTRMIQDIAVGAVDSAPRWIGSAGGVGMFLVPDEAGDAVMWRTDGTSAATRSIAHFDALRFALLNPSVDSPNPYLASTSQFGLELVTPLAAGNHLFFLGRGPGAGIELFALESDAPTSPPPGPSAPVDPPARRGGGGAVDPKFLVLLWLAITLQFLTAALRRRGIIVPPRRGGNPCSSSTPTRSRR